MIHRVASAAWERCNAPTTTVRNALWAMERAGSKTHCVYRYLHIQYSNKKKSKGMILFDTGVSRLKTNTIL